MTHSLFAASAGATMIALVALGSSQPHVAAAGPEQDPPVLTWEEASFIGGAVFGITTATVPPVEDPRARPNQVLLAAGTGLSASQYGDTWTTDDRPGFVTRVLAAPGDEVRFASGPEGVWRSTNNGRSWSRTRVRESDPAHILAISPDWEVDEAAYAATLGDGRLYKTEDGRSSWAEVIVEPGSDRWVAAVAFSPETSSDETVFAATDAGIYKSVNNGQIWELVSDETAPEFGAEAGREGAQGLLISPDYGDDPARLDDPIDATLFAYNEAGVYRSDDDGASWRRLSLDVDLVNQVAVSPGWPRDRTLMAAVHDSDGTVAAVSEDGGESWRRVAGRDGLTGTSVALAVDYAPEYRGTPRNGIFLPMTTKFAAVVTGPTPGLEGSREAYLGTDGDAVWRSSDSGRTWVRVDDGLIGVVSTSVVLLSDAAGAAAGALAGTAMSGLYSSPDGGRTWARASGSGLPLGETQIIHRLRASPQLATDGTILMAASSGVWVSRDRGQTWTLGQGSPAATAIGFSPTFAQDRIARVPGAVTADGGATWSPDPATSSARAIAFSPNYSEDQTLWMAGETSLSVSVNAGQSWEPITDSRIRNREFTEIVATLVPNTVDPMRVFGASDAGVFVAEAPEFEFERVSSAPGGSLYSLAAIYTARPSGAVLLTAGEDGIGYSLNRGLDWVRDRTAPDPSLDGALAADGCVYLVATLSGAARADAVVDDRCVTP